MALEPKKQGGLFAGLTNLSNDSASEKGNADTAKKAAGKSAEKKAASSKKSVNDPSSERIQAESQENTQLSSRSQEPVQSVTKHAAPQPKPPVMNAGEAISRDDTVMMPQAYNGALYSTYEPAAQAYQQGSVLRSRAQLIDGRYKRNPKSFRTCIALTEELHQNIERAKQSGRITSLNDLINNLLTDYFKLN